jgi:hypothetical protein
MEAKPSIPPFRPDASLTRSATKNSAIVHSALEPLILLAVLIEVFIHSMSIDDYCSSLLPNFKFQGKESSFISRVYNMPAEKSA